MALAKSSSWLQIRRRSRSVRERLIASRRMLSLKIVNAVMARRCMAGSGNRFQTAASR